MNAESNPNTVVGPLVLVVEPDADVCYLLQKILEFGGYTPRCCATFAEAKHLAEQEAARVELLILAAPFVQGEVSVLLDSVPLAKVLITTTGYCEEWRTPQHRPGWLLVKPFSADELLERLREVIRH